MRCYWDRKSGESMNHANISDESHTDDEQEIIRRLLSLVRTAAQLIRLRSLTAAAEHIERVADWHEEDAARLAADKQQAGSCRARPQGRKGIDMEESEMIVEDLVRRGAIRRLLVSTGLVCEQAIDDADGFDGETTLGRVVKFEESLILLVAETWWTGATNERATKEDDK